MDFQPCVRCGRALRAPQGINQTGDRSIAIFISGLTVGFRPRVKSRAQRQVFCIGCAVSIAHGPVPDGAFNVWVHAMPVDILKQEKSIGDAA